MHLPCFFLQLCCSPWICSSAELITFSQCEFSERETDGPRDHALISNKKGTMWAATLPSPTQQSRTQELVHYTLHSQLPPWHQKGY